MIEPNLESLDIYQKFEKSEIALHKLQLENAKKNTEILKLREELQQYKSNVANTSTSFPWPEEFKCQWETLFKTMIMDTFENISLNTILFMRTINILIKTVYEISKVKIKEKIIELLKCLNIKTKSDEIINKFFNKYQKILFQNYFNSLFITNEELISKIITQIKNEFCSKKYSKLFSEEEISNIMIDLSSKNMSSFVKEIYILSLYMNINIPQLTIKTGIDVNYRYFNKNEYNNIEGFANEGDICLIIINPPMVRPNIPFRGIKPVVYMIDNPSKEIIDLCEQQKLLKKKREQSKSFCASTNNKLILHKTNSNNINNNNIQLKKNKEKNIIDNNMNNNGNKINKKKSAQLISGCNTNNSSTTDGTTNRDKIVKGNNYNNNVLDMKIYNESSNKKKLVGNNNRININKYNSLKTVDIIANDQRNKKINNLLYPNSNEYKSKSNNKEIKNDKKNLNNQYFNKKEDYSNIFCHNQNTIQKINNIKNKNLNSNINNRANNKNNMNYNYNNNGYNMNINIISKEPIRKISSLSNKNNNENNQMNNCINNIENFADSHYNYINYLNINKLKMQSNININKDKNIINNRNYDLNINYIVENDGWITPLYFRI